ncbi:MAG TPA: hypothetical protein VN893_25825 [Bryobacteraceae bacterium]|nr:hypothetical protein [Bryobacteraceae bacterium]
MRAAILAVLIVASLCAQAQTARPADSKDTPQRTVHAASGAKTSNTSGPEEAGRAANPHALDALSSSTDDLNVIRDANLRKLTRDGCPPEISARTTEVQGRLRAAEAELNGQEPPSAAPDKASPAAPQGSAQAIASDWFKKEEPASTASNPRQKAPKNLVDSVLPGDASKPASPSRPPLSAEKRKALEQDVAALKAELEHLSVACPGAKP